MRSKSLLEQAELNLGIKAQVYIYNRMLGRLQDFEPPKSYLLGRGWQRTQSGVPYRCSNAMERLGPVPQDGTVANRVLIATAVEDALRWARRSSHRGQRLAASARAVSARALSEYEQY